MENREQGGMGMTEGEARAIAVLRRVVEALEDCASIDDDDRAEIIAIAAEVPGVI